MRCFRIFIYIFSFKLVLKYINFVNSDDCIGKIFSSSIRSNPNIDCFLWRNCQIPQLVIFERTKQVKIHLEHCKIGMEQLIKSNFNQDWLRFSLWIGSVWTAEDFNDSSVRFIVSFWDEVSDNVYFDWNGQFS